MGQLPEGAITLIETVEDVARFEPRDPANLSYVTQTTLSVDDTVGILDALKARFPLMTSPHKEDICYATTNRQEAVKGMAEACDLVLVVGSKNSSNSLRLVEVAMRAGARDARLLDDASGVDWSWFDGVSTVGVTAGASAPEVLVQELVERLRALGATEVRALDGISEGVVFPLPRALSS